jgi:hypothetical protein
MRDPEELISAYFDDLLAPGEFEQLRLWLAAAPENKRQFVRASMLHSRVRDLLHEREVRSLFAEPEDSDYWVNPGHIASLLEEEEAVAEKRALEAEEALRRAEEAAVRRHELLLDRSLLTDPPVQQLQWVYAAAAILAMAMFAGWMTFTREAGHTPPPVARRQDNVGPATPAKVGLVARALNARWSHDEQLIDRGEELEAGRLKLSEGVVEIELTTGASLIVEAPAELELVSADRVHFERGQLVAHVPPQAVGFTLRSKAATFVDLGTEFGVQISESGDADIHVLNGEVALVPGNRKTEQPSRTLQMGQANSVSADGATVASIPFDADRFLRRVPSTAFELAVLRSRPLAAWRLGEWSDNSPIVSDGRLNLPSKANAGVEVAANEIAGGPQGETRFIGNHDGIDLGIEAALGTVSNFTCEAWVMPNAGTNGPQRIFSSFDRPHSGMAMGLVNGAWYKLADNELKLQLTLYGVYDCVGTAAVRPDRWVHVAATVDAQGKPALYVDGRWTPLRYRQVSTGIDGARIDHWSDDLAAPAGIASAGLARIGRNPVGGDGAISPEQWQGLINSVAVYDRVLGAEEIAEHAEMARRSGKAAAGPTATRKGVDQPRPVRDEEREGGN